MCGLCFCILKLKGKTIISILMHEFKYFSGVLILLVCLFTTPYSFSNPHTETESHRPLIADDQRLIAKFFFGNLNPQLGLDSPNTAACISLNCSNGAMNYLAQNAESSGAWVGRFRDLDSLISCIERTPINTKNLIIGAHGCPDGCGPVNLSTYQPIAKAIKMKGIQHVGLASCSVGANAPIRENDSLPKLLARESGARVTSYSRPVYSGPNQFSAAPGTNSIYMDSRRRYK